MRRKDNMLFTVFLFIFRIPFIYLPVTRVLNKECIFDKKLLLRVGMNYKVNLFRRNERADFVASALV
jgi:hypothetical protein